MDTVALHHGEAQEESDLGRSRRMAIRVIAQTLLSESCKEQGLPIRRLLDLDFAELKRFIEPAAFIASWTLDEDRRDTALFCMADTICVDRTGSPSLLHESRREQHEFYQLAVSCIHSLTENMKDVPPDRFYREEACRTVDAMFPKAVRS